MASVTAVEKTLYLLHATTRWQHHCVSVAEAWGKSQDDIEVACMLGGEMCI